MIYVILPYESNNLYFIILILSSSVSCKRNKDKLFTSLSHRRTGIDFKNWVKESETFNVLDYSYL